MPANQNPEPAPGWIGGFAQSDSAFAYPQPDLSSLDMLENMANIDKLQRQQKVEWPEFSWETEKGNPDPRRCYQKFAPDISRLGYTDEGRVYSIICPQQGFFIPKVGAMNVEVSVTGQRGWANETNKEMAADMTVEGKIWFSPARYQRWFVKLLWFVFRNSKIPFPADKARAIRVTTHMPLNALQPIFPLKFGESTEFPIPDFARHPEAWAVGHLGVEIGPIIKTGNAEADRFNELIMRVFNLASDNMLQSGNVLSWNVWFTAPELVNQLEWQTHAERWRLSIDTGHGSPDGEGTAAMYYDGTAFKPVKELMDDAFKDIISHILEREKISWWYKFIVKLLGFFR